jgi:TRAP-type mannitol/chloroaromatic compound transport system permease large subunit
MSPAAIGGIGILALLVLIALRVPVAIAMGVVGIVGGVAINGWFSLGFVLGSQPFVTVLPYTLSVIPLFVMMGAFAARAGLSQSLYRALHALIGHWRGGLASATVGPARCSAPCAARASRPPPPWRGSRSRRCARSVTMTGSRPAPWRRAARWAS